MKKLINWFYQKRSNNKLDLLNSIPVKKYDTNSNGLYTVTCENNEENCNKIMQLDYTYEDVQRFVNESGLIEMTHFAWEIAKFAKTSTSIETGEKINEFKGWYI